MTRGRSTHPLQEASLLAKVGDPGSIVVTEHVVAEDSVGDLRSVNQVHLQKPGLEMALFGFVILKSIEQERGCRLNHILRHEDIDHLKDRVVLSG